MVTWCFRVKNTYDCNLTTELVLDLPHLDRIWAVFIDNMKQFCSRGELDNVHIGGVSQRTFDTHLACIIYASLGSAELPRAVDTRSVSNLTR